MLISRRLAHKLQTKLTSVLCLIDMGATDAKKLEEAKRAAREISLLINSYVESEEEERERKHRNDQAG